MSLKEADPIAYAISRARPRDVETLAIRIGAPEGKIRSWRHDTTSLSPWVIRVIADVLRLDDTVLDQHWHCRRRRHARDAATQRELEEAAA
jgi:hypothetical protein